MLFNLKIAANPEELMSDSELDQMIKKFSPQVGLMDDLVDSLKDEVEAYVGLEKLQEKLDFEYGLGSLRKDLGSDIAQTMLEFREIKNTADVMHLGIFYRGITSMPLFNVVSNKSENKKGQILVNTFSWGFNEYLYFAKDHKNRYLYLELREQINLFLSQLKNSELSRHFSL